MAHEHRTVTRAAVADQDWQIARKWLDRALDLEMRAADYDPDERDLAEVHLLEVEAETLRKCAAELLARDTAQASTEEEIKF